MPPKADDVLPGTKLLQLYQRLTLSGRKHFLLELVRDLRRSPQAINRMIEIIEANLGKDAYIERGIEGRRKYFRLRSMSEAKTFGFSFEELRFIAMCRDLAAPHLPANVARRIDQTLESLALHLGERSYRSTGSDVMFFRGKGFIDYSPHLDKISVLRDAIGKREICAVVYKAGGRDKPTEYRYAPGGIVSVNGALYVQGYKLDERSLLMGRPTTFSLHRIESISPLGEYFGFDAAPEDTRYFGLDWHEPKRVTVRFDAKVADYVRDRVWSDDQTIVELDGGDLSLTISTTSEKELQSWVWSFGGLASIVAAP